VFPCNRAIDAVVEHADTGGVSGGGE